MHIKFLWYHATIITKIGNKVNLWYFWLCLDLFISIFGQIRIYIEIITLSPYLLKYLSISSFFEISFLIRLVFILTIFSLPHLVEPFILLLNRIFDIFPILLMQLDEHLCEITALGPVLFSFLTFLVPLHYSQRLNFSIYSRLGQFANYYIDFLVLTMLNPLILNSFSFLIFSIPTPPAFSLQLHIFEQSNQDLQIS